VGQVQGCKGWEKVVFPANIATGTQECCIHGKAGFRNSLTAALTIAGLTWFSSARDALGETAIALHTEGAQIRDSTGRSILLRGVNHHRFIDVPDGAWDPPGKPLYFGMGLDYPPPKHRASTLSWIERHPLKATTLFTARTYIETPVVAGRGWRIAPRMVW
jgi:hypothetical protein